MTPEEMKEIRAIVFAALVDHEEMKKTQRLKVVKNAIRGTVAATALSSVGCIDLSDRQSLIARNAAVSKAVVSQIQQQTARSFKSNDYEDLVKQQTVKGVVHFAFNSSALALAHQDRLDSFVEQLPKKNVELIVVGHTDSSGNADYNLKLGKKRAQMVAKYLAWKGVSVRTIRSKGEQISGNGWGARRVDIIVNHSAKESLAINLPPVVKKPSAVAHYQPQSVVNMEVASSAASADVSSKTQPNQVAKNKQTIMGVVHFPTNSAGLALAHKERLDSFIKQLPKDAELTVIGRTDTKGGTRQNSVLGQNRALTVAKYLASQGATVLSYGNKGEQASHGGWSSRRVDIIVSHTSADDLAINLPPLAKRTVIRKYHVAKARPIYHASTQTEQHKSVKVANNPVKPVENNQNKNVSVGSDLLYDIQTKMTDTGLDEIR